MNIRAVTVAFVTGVLLFVGGGCSRLDRLEGRIQETEDRLDRLEGRIDRLENAVKALDAACRGGKVITDVVRIDGEPAQWCIHFSDETEISISDGAQGTAGAMGNTPLVRVDLQGYLTVSYDNGTTYVRMLDEEGKPLLVKEKGDKGDQGEKGEDGICVRVVTDADGFYAFELYYPDEPDEVIKSVETPFNSSPANLISGISQDQRTREITLTMSDGSVFTFDKRVCVPASIVLTGMPVVRLSEGASASFEFRVNPSNSEFNYDVGHPGCAIELDRTGPMTRSGYVTPPSQYRLIQAEQVYSETGVLKEGQYRAVIQDEGGPEPYDDTAALVLTVDDGYGRTVQVSSAAFEIKFCDNVFSSFSFLVENNPGVVLADVHARIEGLDITLDTPLITDLSSLVPSFTSGGDKVFVEGREQWSGKSACDFSGPVRYTVFSSIFGSMEYTVRIRRTGLPVLFIDTPGGCPVTSKEVWTENASIRLLREDGTEDYVSDALQIRGRGNSTWNFTKKPYALKLNKKAELLGMPGHMRWCLLANWLDRALLRNDIAFHLSGLTGLAWTPRGRFVELVLNGKHLGNYYLCEQIKVDPNRVDIQEMTAEDTEGDALTGGYLVELDTYWDEVHKFRSAVRVFPYQFKSPDDDVLTSEQFSFFVNTSVSELTS